MSRFMAERLRNFAAYVPGEQPKDMAKLIKLNTNESPFPPAPGVIDAMTREAAEELRLYSNLAATELTQALAEDLGVSPAQIAVGNGSDEVLYFAMMAFGEGGAAFADITYGFYAVWARLLGIEARIVPLGEDFSIDPANYMGNDRMILIANPNAPTGIAMTLGDIERIVRGNPDQVVLVDEAYVDFGGESAVSLLKRYDNLLISRTFSKSRQMAGARLGFLVGNEALIADVEKIRFSINPYNVNSLTQRLGAASVRDRDYFEWACAQIVKVRGPTVGALERLGFEVLPSAANFIFAKCPSVGGRQYMEALRQRNILVRWFDADRIRDYVRITIGSSEQMAALVAATKEIIGGAKA